MHDLAHVTDLHLVEPEHSHRRGAQWRRLHYLSAGRPIDAAARSSKAIEALRTAARHAKHVVVTGDLTEDGIPAQFELLAQVLHAAGVEPGRVTLVPGNHDRYSDPAGFECALQGPLRAYAAASGAGAAIDLGEALLMPISTTIEQSWLRSAGRLHPEDVRRIRGLASDARRRRKLALVAQHHPPQGSGGPIWNWIDGLVNAATGLSLLREHTNLQVVHGHTHRLRSAAFGRGRPAQAHSGAAVVACADSVRYYALGPDALHPVPAPQALPGRVKGGARVVLA